MASQQPKERKVKVGYVEGGTYLEKEILASEYEVPDQLAKAHIHYVGKSLSFLAPKDGYKPALPELPVAQITLGTFAQQMGEKLAQPDDFGEPAIPVTDALDCFFALKFLTPKVFEDRFANTIPANMNSAQKKKYIEENVAAIKKFSLNVQFSVDDILFMPGLEKATGGDFSDEGLKKACPAHLKEILFS